MNREEVIEKVKKILALAKDNPNENESISATLKAQKIITEWNIDKTELNTEDDQNVIEDIVYQTIPFTREKRKTIDLAGILARNFRCNAILETSREKKTINFIGYETDAEICKNTFIFLIDKINQLSKNYIQQQKILTNNTKGLKESYEFGFLDELRFRLEQQSRSLMIIKDEKIDEKTKVFFNPNSSTSPSYKRELNREAVLRGKKDARELYESGHIESEKKARLKGN